MTPVPQLRTVPLPILRNDLKHPINYSAVQAARIGCRSELEHLHSSACPNVSLSQVLCTEGSGILVKFVDVTQASGHHRQSFSEHLILAYRPCLRHEPRSHCHDLLPLNPSHARRCSHCAHVAPYECGYFSTEILNRSCSGGALDFSGRVFCQESKIVITFNLHCSRRSTFSVKIV